MPPVCIYTDSPTRFACSTALIAALAVDVLNPPFSRPALLPPPISSKHLKSTILSSRLPSLASSLTARPPLFPSAVASHPSGEEFINRSLLDSVDAQADAEPISSSSDSEATGTSGNAFGSLPSSSSMSIGSPSVPYHISMQSQQTARPDSPSSNMTIPSNLKSHPLDPYSAATQSNNISHSMYNSMNNISVPPDYNPLNHAEHDALNLQAKLNGFGSPAFNSRASMSFNPFPPRARPNNVPFRDTSAAFNTAAYQQSGDMFGAQNPQTQAPGFGFDSMSLPSRAHDFGNVGGQASSSMGANGTAPNKLSFSLDGYRPGMDSLLQSQQLNQQASLSNTLPLHQQASQQQFHGVYTNGLSHLSHGAPGTLPSHTQFGPTLPTTTAGSGAANGQGGPLAGGPGMNHVNGSNQSHQQEEISTIFVVGFPEDMQVGTAVRD